MTTTRIIYDAAGTPRKTMFGLTLREFVLALVAVGAVLVAIYK